MIIYDVIAMVAPDALTSNPKGTYGTGHHFASRGDADACAAQFNRCCMVRGIAYTVDAVDELSPDRYPTIEMIREEEKRHAWLDAMEAARPA